MFKPAFSTVACPEWTLDRVACAADDWGFEGVELRTFGDSQARLACDPAWSDPSKTRALFAEAGVPIVSVGTGLRFDEPIRPPVIGEVCDKELSVREAKRATALARGVGAAFVRVFAFEPAKGESRHSAMRRIVERLKLVCDDARNTGVRIALENGGGFCAAAELRELLERVGSPHLGASYSLAAGSAALDDPDEALDLLARDLIMARVKDARGSDPAPIGEGELGCEAFIRALARRGFEGPVVVEWDRLWRPDLADAEAALSGVVERLYAWATAAAPGPAVGAA